jgi:hypothetical protein
MRGISLALMSLGLVPCAVFGVAAIGCGPSPAMQTRRAEALPPNAAVVVVCDDDELADDAEAPAKKPIEYVRIDEWQAPPAAREIESRIEPRGNKPPDYVQLPSLTMHREIAPMTTWRTGRYWY